MKHFGLLVEKDRTTLFDVETGEIITDNKTEIQKHLQAHENNYLLQVF